MVYLLLVASANGGTGPSPLGGFVGSNPTVYTIFNTGTERQFMKKALLVLLLITNTAMAQAWNWKDPESKFDATKNEVMDVKLRWVVVKDIDAACSAENKKRGGGVFRFNVQACSFWEGKECIIMTPKMASIHNLGHEVLHCFRGAYH